jgi:NADH:ubiquinone oxidoreductase subunit E
MLGILKAMGTTLAHLPRRKITVQYPEEREPLPERSRGLFRVATDAATGEPVCRACTLCETNCPVQVIRVHATSRYDLPAVDEARILRVRAASQPRADLAPLMAIVESCRESGAGLGVTLAEAQGAYGYLPRAVLERISVESGVPLAQVYGRASSCEGLRLTPRGRHVLTVCHGTGCLQAGADLVTAAFTDELGIHVGATTADGLFSLESAGCLGACAEAPAVLVGDRVHGCMTPEKARGLVDDLRRSAEVPA